MNKVKLTFAAIAFLLTAGTTWALNSSFIPQTNTSSTENDCSRNIGDPINYNSADCVGDLQNCCYDPQTWDPVALED